MNFPLDSTTTVVVSDDLVAKIKALVDKHVASRDIPNYEGEYYADAGDILLDLCPFLTIYGVSAIVECIKFNDPGVFKSWEYRARNHKG